MMFTEAELQLFPAGGSMTCSHCQKYNNQVLMFGSIYQGSFAETRRNKMHANYWFSL